jgi:carbon-monoxide dehydrogenase large subunit
MSGGAVSVAAEIVAGRIKKIAAHLLQVRAEDITFRDGRIFSGEASVS